MFSLYENYSYFINSTEHYSEKDKTTSYLHAIVFLCASPDVKLFDFAQKLASSSYHVYIVIDNNSYTIPPYDTEKVTVVRYELGVAEEKGYKGSVLWFLNRASSRCKALYYLCEINTIEYNGIWMIEDDVFIPSLHTLSFLDEKYPSSESDLLCSSNTITNLERGDWHWFRNKGKIELPWAGSMICAIRVSQKLLDEIKKYANQHGQLLMDEMLFNTLALHAKLNVVTIPELSSVVYQHEWKINDITEQHLYHPIKNYQTQNKYRSQLGYEYYESFDSVHMS